MFLVSSEGSNDLLVRFCVARDNGFDIAHATVAKFKSVAVKDFVECI